MRDVFLQIYHIFLYGFVRMYCIDSVFQRLFVYFIDFIRFVYSFRRMFVMSLRHDIINRAIDVFALYK
jgi:hypothetical protein